MTDAVAGGPAPSLDEAAEASYRRTTLAIAAGTGLASFSMNFWWPFLPLYLRDVGATSDANALFWVALATTVQGFARLITGPIWGVLSDRYGRKLMFARALFAATITTVIAAAAHAPWVIVVSLTMQGLFSGFVPAAIALASVSVPDARLSRSLGTVTGGQYLGSTLGPAFGAVLASTLGFRGAIVAAAILPALAALWVVLAVPRDVVAPRLKALPATVRRKRWRPSLGTLRGFNRQFYLAIFLYFALFALNQLVRVATPIALEDIAGKDSARAASGISFTLAGAAAVVGVMVLARFATAKWTVRQTLVIFCVAAAAAHPLLAAGQSVVLYMAGLIVISLINGAAMPSTNTLIAGSVDASRRGTAFGLASSAQAIAFMVGPMAAAGFATVSLPLGFMVGGAIFLGLALLLGLFLREPEVLRVDAEAG